MEFHHSKYKNVTEAHREKQAGHCERSEHGQPAFRGGPQCSREKGGLMCLSVPFLGDLSFFLEFFEG